MEYNLKSTNPKFISLSSFPGVGAVSVFLSLVVDDGVCSAFGLHANAGLVFSVRPIVSSFLLLGTNSSQYE